MEQEKDRVFKKIKNKSQHAISIYQQIETSLI